MKKRILSLVLSSVLVIATVINPMISYANTEESDDSVVVVACSDFQSPGGDDASAETVTAILSQIKHAGYGKVDGFLCAGDYNYDETNDTYIEPLKSAVLEEYSISDENMVFVEGNHDPMWAPGISPSGANDTADYGVYVIHNIDYPSHGGTESTVKSTADALATYLQGKVNDNNEKPIFIVSHLPLHYTMRTYGSSDGIYGKYIFDVINKYASMGQEIIFLYGHNHGNGYEDYLGGSSVYMMKGDTIYLASPGQAQVEPSAYTLNFTYMNAGYLGYYYTGNAGSDTTLTMTVFEIEDGVITVERYSKNGVHNLKSTGVWNAALGETKEWYGQDDNYLLTTYSSPQSIGKMAVDGDVQVFSPGVTGLEVYKNSRLKDDKLHKAYAYYEVETMGYTQGHRATVRVALSQGDGFDREESIFIIEEKSDMVRLGTIVDGSVVFQTECLGDFALVQFRPVFSNPTQKTIYRQVSSLTDNSNYMIVNLNTAGNAYALSNNTAGISAKAVEILADPSGCYIDTNDTELIWKWIFKQQYGAGAGYLQNQSTNQYLYLENGTTLKASTVEQTDWGYWRIASSGFCGYKNFASAQSGEKLYLKYDNGFVKGSSANKVFVFGESSITVEHDGYLDSLNGYVTVDSDLSEKTGSKVIISGNQGISEIVEVTVSMLRDANGQAVNINEIGKQSDLTIYYNDVLISDEYTLHVCHENGSNYIDVSQYRSGDVYTYPEKKGYVFAGWYEDADFKTPLGKDKNRDYAYAKFVNEEVLGAKYQIAANTTMGSTETSMRLVTSVDSTYYKNVGFVLRVNGEDSKPCISDTVYATIIGNANGIRKTYYPKETFDISSRYFMVCEITKIPNSEFNTDITIIPQWETLDGTIVKGMSKTIKISDACTDQAIENADGSVTVQNRDAGGHVEYTFTNLDIQAGDTVSFTVTTILGGDPQGYFFVEGIKDGNSLGAIYNDNTTIETYAQTITAITDCDSLHFYYRHGDWSSLGDMSVTFRLTAIKKVDQTISNEDGSVTVKNRDEDGGLSYTFTNLDIKAGDSITFTITVPGGDSRGFMGVEGIKDGVNFGSFYYDSDTVETYTRTITASADYDALNFWFRHGDWTVLGDMSITIKLN